jgi:Peptidase inhibitor family I36
MRASRLLLALVMAAALVAFLPGPVARAVPSDCPAGALCVYWYANYGAPRFKFFDRNASWQYWTIEDDDSSWCNNGTTGRLARVWTGRNFTGAWQKFARGACWPHDADYDNRGSSNDWPWS